MDSCDNWFINGVKAFIEDNIKKIHEESDKRCERVMKKYGGKGCLILAKEDFQKVYPDVPWENPDANKNDS